MLISVITAVTTNVCELAQTLDSQHRALACTPGDVRLQVLVVAPEFTQDINAAIEHVSAVNRLSVVPVRDAGVGIAAAFNAGLDAAQGDLITVLNAGDLWFEETLVHVIAAHALAPDSLVHSAITFEDVSGVRYVVHSDPARLNRRMSVFHPTLFVPDKVQRAVGYYDTSFRLAMDSNWCHRAVSAGVTFSEAGASLAVMRLGGRSDLGFVDALGEFRRSAVEEGLTPGWLAAFDYWRVRLGKHITHIPALRRWLIGWRAFARRTGPQ